MPRSARLDAFASTGLVQCAWDIARARGQCGPTLPIAPTHGDVLLDLDHLVHFFARRLPEFLSFRAGEAESSLVTVQRLLRRVGSGHETDERKYRRNTI